MRVLVVGSGAREHALTEAIAVSTHRPEVIVAPGNGGTSAFAENVDVAADDIERLVQLATERAVDLVVVGPEAPLVAGLADTLREAGIAVFGPSKAAAELEGSKAMSKIFMRRHGIPTAAFEVFDAADKAKAYVRGQDRPMVIKADGLAAGKGVVVAETVDEACEAIDDCLLKGRFGAAGSKVVVEECLVGQEVSFHVISDGQRIVPLAAAQDHKRAYDGERGPNTGGMGAYSPPPIINGAVEETIMKTIVEPTFAGLKADGVEFVGVLFVGLMMTADGPMVLEYNVRFGDPECQCLLARIESDVLDLLDSSARGKLDETAVRWKHPFSMSVVLASKGYPGLYEKGLPIEGIEDAKNVGAKVYHAGTRREGSALLTDGGRVLTLTAAGDGLKNVRSVVYRAAGLIRFRGAWCRRDIGWRAG